MLEDGELREVGETRDQDTARYDEPVLRVEKLTTRFDVGHNLFGRVTHRVHAVEEVSFDVYPGETLALVGESGSGKSTIGKTLQQLIAPTGGAVRYNGQDIFSMDSAGRQRLRQEIQYIFQDPYASLDPRKTVAFSIAEPIRTHGLLSDEAAIARRVGELLEQVGLKPEHAARYPHEFSGGQRQRVCIARALASNPIIADESVSALDVSIQAQILNLLMDLQKDRGLSYLFITHDMAVVEKVSHRVAVLYLGQIVELGTRRQIFESPQHAYTRKLLAAVPVAEPGRHIDTSLIEGEIPSPVRLVGDEPAIIPWPSSRPATWSPARPDSLTSAHSRPWRRPCISSARPSPPPRWHWPWRRPAAAHAAGTLNVAINQDPGSWDPIDTFVTFWGSVGSNLYDGLTMRGADLKLQPGLATKWEYLDDNKRLRFTLRQGVKFHNGEPFNAEAVKFTFDRLLGAEGAKGPQKSNYDSIGEVKVVDENTVDFILKQPDPVLLTKLAGYGAMIVPPKYIQERARTTSTPTRSAPARSSSRATSPRST